MKYLKNYSLEVDVPILLVPTNAIVQAVKKVMCHIFLLLQFPGIQIHVDEGGAGEEGSDEGDDNDQELSEDEKFFTEAPVYDENASFSNMNLSRPLLKVNEFI